MGGKFKLKTPVAPSVFQQKIVLFVFLGLIVLVGLVSTGIFINKQLTIIPAQTTIDSTVNWKIYTYEKIGFSFKLPIDWTLLSYQNPSTAIVENKILNDSDPEGQYYKEKVISGPSFFLGPKDILNNFTIPQDNQKLANLTAVINGNFLYNGFLNEAGYIKGETSTLGAIIDIKYSSLNIDGKEVVLAESENISEAFIPLENPDGLKYALILTIEDNSNIKMLRETLSTFKFIK